LTPYLPGSFDWPPRNPAEKINSRYKAWEWLQYIYGYGLVLFYHILPRKYWQHFCKLVYGIQILYQCTITAKQLAMAHKALLQYLDKFEILYYQRKISRMHFVWPAIHALCHLAPEASCVGPGGCSLQWTIKQTIGNLGEEVKQDSNPFANMSQWAIRCCQVNVLKAMVPDLEPLETHIPRGGI
jgi:hypothetical protein